MREKKWLNITLTVIFIIALVAFMITFSIGLPIYFRPFYYWQIKTLGLEEATGWSYETIKTAYDEVLNFCTLPGGTFSAGALKFSEEGAAHFADCKALFNLNLFVMIGSFVALVVLLILQKVKVFRLCRPLKRHAYLWSAVIALALPLILGSIIAIDFDKAFKVFHAVFFPGKDNWMFYPDKDEIIRVMPEQFFVNCVIFIGVGLVTFACALIAADLILSHRERKRATTAQKTPD